jgi:murein DD-endopeptidase MepM/ murein hydrolase activator NlpD
MPLWDEIEARLQNPVVAGLAVATVGTLVFVGVRHLLQHGNMAALPPGTIPPRPSPAPFAEIGVTPVWPVVTKHPEHGVVSYTDVHGAVHGNWARQFHAVREGRWHAGVDLYGYNGDPVVAIADGVVVAVQSFHLGSWAILVDHGSAVALYGEVRPNSWNEFGVNVGSRVHAGQPIARLACMVGTEANCESHMLHFEMYAPGTRQNKPWYQGDPPPPNLRDPSWVLLAAAPAGVNA